MIKKIFRALTKDNIKKGLIVLKTQGPSMLLRKAKSKIKGPATNYDKWFKKHKVTEDELSKQREKTFNRMPVISILVPTYNTPIKFLREMIDSVAAQSYPNWQLCIADGSSDNEELLSVLREYSENDKRIVFVKLEKNGGISENTNGALALATGDYISLLDHDDLLTPDCLYKIAEAINEDDYDIIYTDEDKVTSDLKKHMDPQFKPDYSPDYFRTHNYITHFFVVKSSIMKKVGKFDSKYDGAQDYDIMFRCIEHSKKIKHIPEILYHWRVHNDSTAGNPESKMYAYEAGRKALSDHLERIGQKATVEHTDMWAIYKVTYDTAPNPLVSIIIPNKDHIDDLDKCVKSIYELSTYKNFEFVIVENNSENKETFEYYKKMEEAHDNFHVFYWKDGFNYSKINNFGVLHAKGDYLLLLNNDTELIAPYGISEMLGICMRSEVGIVGAKLLFADDTIQHAGIVLGFGGFAGHVFSGLHKDDLGFMLRPNVNCNYSAVTAACLMTKRSVFEEVGGLSEEFVVALNDVDYCLKVREKDYMVVYSAYSLWHHYESKSRGYEDTPEKLKRFEGEVELFKKRWKKVLEAGDPYYNKNFPVTLAPFTLPDD